MHGSSPKTQWVLGRDSSSSDSWSQVQGLQRKREAPKYSQALETGK